MATITIIITDGETADDLMVKMQATPVPEGPSDMTPAHLAAARALEAIVGEDGTKTPIIPMARRMGK